MTQAPLFTFDDEEAPQAPKQSAAKHSPAATGTPRTVEDESPKEVEEGWVGQPRHPAPRGLMAGGPAPKPQDKPLRPGQRGYKPEPLPPGSCAGSLGWITLDFTGWGDYPGTYTPVACEVCGIVFRVPYSVGTILDALAWAGRQSYAVPIHGAPKEREP